MNTKTDQFYIEFKDKSDLIIANRMTKDLKSHSQKVYTRDIFFNN